MSNPGGTPRTWWSGKSAPEDQRGPSAATVASAVLIVASPLGAFTAFVGFMLFTAARLSWKVIAGTTAVIVAIWLLSGGISGPVLHDYLMPWREAIAAIRDGSLGTVAGKRWPAWLAAQAPLSIVLGSVASTVHCWWKWIRRPAWVEYDRVAGPLDLIRRHRTIKAIAADTRGPSDGITLGRELYGRRIDQKDTEGGAHTLVAGGSGAGKTTTMLVGMRDVIRLGRGLVVVDLKGGPDVPAQLADWAARYGRRFLHWTISDPHAGYHGPADGAAFYDPIGRGDPSRRKDLIIGSQKWDVEHYKRMAAEYLQIAFKVAQAVPSGKDSFADILDLLTPQTLRARVMGGADLGLRQIVDDTLGTTVNRTGDIEFRLDDSQQSAIRTVGARLREMVHSTAGAWLRRDPSGHRDIDLRRAADEGWVVVFSLDSSNYEETSAQVAGLIIQDLKTLSSELRQTPAKKPFHVVVDEFAAIGSDNVLGLLNKARDAKMPVTLATQALADLKRADPAFVDQVLGIVGCFIIHRANTDADAEVFAGLTGKHQVYKQTYSVEMTSGMPGTIGTGAATGQGMIREEEEYRVLPREFQDLEPGQMVYIAKSPKARVINPVWVVRENPVTANTVARPAPEPLPAYPPAIPAEAGVFTAALTEVGESPFADPATVRPVQRPAVVDIDLSAPARPRPQQEQPAADEPVEAQPSGLPARPANPLISPEAFRSRDRLTAAPSPAAETPAVAVAGRPVAAPAIPQQPVPVRPTLPARPAGLPIARPAMTPPIPAAAALPALDAGTAVGPAPVLASTDAPDLPKTTTRPAPAQIFDASEWNDR